MSGRIVEDEAGLAAIVRGAKTVAVIGMKSSDDAPAAAYSIPAMLRQRGYRVIPINPALSGTRIFGEPVLAGVADLSVRPDIFDVFRRSEAIPEVADEILALPAELRAPVVWLQTGIVHHDAAERLTAAGIDVVMDRCLGVYVSRYLPHQTS
ncbi:MAG TPA: CoA-binding protein [Gemmatimonadales bacterium]|nr:CoA-binding protein [Gemmatimonadales bacterium]